MKPQARTVITPHCWWHGASLSTLLTSMPASAESSYFCTVYFCCKAKVKMLALFSHILYSVNCVLGMRGDYGFK